jgi:hypothetical protein
MIRQATPFAAIVSAARASETLLTNHVHPVLVLVSEIASDASSPTHQVTEVDSLYIQQTQALRKIPAHGLVFVLRKRDSGLVRDRVGIGRDPNADISIPNTKMSRYHAYFSITPRNEWYITDANSKNGSVVGGSRLAAGASYLLPETTTLTLGGIEFNFYLPAPFITLCRRFLEMPS